PAGGSRYKRAGMSVRAMAVLGLTHDEARAELEKLRVHVDDPDYDFETWYAVIDGELKSPLGEIDETVFAELEARERFGLTENAKSEVKPEQLDGEPKKRKKTNLD